MVVPLPTRARAANVQKSRKKSRLGCRNCKLRKVKCDELKPTCMNCKRFRVACNYDKTAPDLHTAGERVAVGPLSQVQASTNKVILGMFNRALQDYQSASGIDSYQLQEDDLGLLSRFQARSVFTLTTPAVGKGYRQIVVNMCGMHPYLLHMVFTWTAMHDRFLRCPKDVQATTIESFHWSQAAALFNAKLSHLLDQEESDALWATAVLMGAASFFSIESTDLEESWPLRPGSKADLAWLKMYDGMRTLWQVANPMGHRSAFRVCYAEEVRDKTFFIFAEHFSGIEGLPPALVELCEMNESSDSDNNPYCTMLHLLAPLLETECNSENVLEYLSFPKKMHADFRVLVEAKEPRALLIMAHWYGTICYSHWWVATRAMLECRTTCIYLQRHHGHDFAIQNLLGYPKSRCGLSPRDRVEEW